MSEIDPRLSRLYHEASTEGPSAAVDAAILAAARQQVAAPRRGERSRWQRWLVPASLMATLVLGVSISLLVERKHPDLLQGDAAGPVPPRLESQPASDAASARARKEVPSAVIQAEEPVPRGAVPVRPAAPATSGVFKSEARHAPPAPPAETLPATPSVADAFPAEQIVKSVEPNAAQESSVATDAAAGLGANAPAAAKTAPMRMRTLPRSPESWLDDIRRLKREGRDKEAAEQLKAFQKAYPGFIVPADLSR